MKKILSFDSVAEFINYQSAILVPRLELKLDKSKYYTQILVFSGSQYLTGSALAFRLLHLIVGKTFSFHVSLSVISKK